MILEQSNDDDDSFVDTRPRRKIDAFGVDSENISLIEDDYVIVDPITEGYRAQLNLQLSASNSNKKSFFDENLQNSDQSSLKSPSPKRYRSELANKQQSMQMSEGSDAAHVHVSQLNVGLTDCSEDENEDVSDTKSQLSNSSEQHFNIEKLGKDD